MAPEQEVIALRAILAETHQKESALKNMYDGIVADLKQKITTLENRVAELQPSDTASR